MQYSCLQAVERKACNALYVFRTRTVVKDFSFFLARKKKKKKKTLKSRNHSCSPYSNSNLSTILYQPCMNKLKMRSVVFKLNPITSCLIKKTSSTNSIWSYWGNLVLRLGGSMRWARVTMFLANFSCLVHEFGTFRSMFLVEFKKENTRGAKNDLMLLRRWRKWHQVSIGTL